MFASVRQAIAYVLNTSEFAQAFTGGYGTVVYGPYSPDFDMWAAVAYMSRVL
jgi:peptide/nickel transport system substrate-binding protein